MFHVLFQVRPSAAGYQQYLDTAAALRPQLETIDGFLSVERFRSVDREGWILSLSKWADEASLVKWRTMPDHHQAQRAGRDGVFDDYRLRVAQVMMQVQSDEPGQQWFHRSAYPGTQEASRFVSVLEAVGLDREAVDHATTASDSEWYESLANPQKMVWIIGWRSEQAASHWYRQTHATLVAMPGVVFKLSLTALKRDYGLFPREEAPQYYPPVVRQANL